MPDPSRFKPTAYNHLDKFIRIAARLLCAPLMIISFTLMNSASVNAAELVIISGSGSDFKIGQVINSASNIQLKDGATLTLISQNGKLVVLTGPRSGPVKTRDPEEKTESLIPSLKKIISGEKTEADSLGVMRSLGTNRKAVPENPWAIIATRSGKYCVSLSRPVVLWRPDSQKTRALVLLNTGNENEVKTVWHAGQNILYWPRLLQLVDGATYRVDLAGNSRLPRLTIAIVPELPTPAHAAVWMSQNGCPQQALRLLTSIKKGMD